jgi:hypothetical protein
VIWPVIGSLVGGALYLAARTVMRHKSRDAAADASGLAPAPDLSHLPAALQKTALWTLSDGGFERRVVHGVVTRGNFDVDVTAFDLETLRERRGEWAFLPVDQPFRIGGVVSVVACTIDRTFPHVLFKKAGQGDRREDDDALDRMLHVAKAARTSLGVQRSYAAELPDTLPTSAIDVAPGWRAYSKAPIPNIAAALDQLNRRDLVIELVDSLVIVYPAAREAAGADALADLSSLAMTIVDALRRADVTLR